MSGQVAHGQAVRVGGHEAQAVVLRGEQHAGEDRPVVVGARGAHHLAQGVAERRRRHGDTGFGRARQARVVVDRQRSHAELRPPAGDAHVVGGHGHLDLAVAQRADDLGREAGRQDDTAVAVTADGDRQLDRQVQIRAGDGQLVTLQLEAKARQHRERAALRPVAARPAVASASASRSRSQRNFTASLLPFEGDDQVIVVIGAVDCAQPGIVPASGCRRRPQRASTAAHSATNDTLVIRWTDRSCPHLRAAASTPSSTVPARWPGHAVFSRWMRSVTWS